jgi:hypothetical protein
VLVVARGREAWCVCWSSGGGPGGCSGVAPPVPFPNTVVKRPSAHDTAPATAWDNRSVPGPPLIGCFAACHNDRSSWCAWLPERWAGAGAASTLTIEEWWGA